MGIKTPSTSIPTALNNNRKHGRAGTKFSRHRCNIPSSKTTLLPFNHLQSTQNRFRISSCDQPLKAQQTRPMSQIQNADHTEIKKCPPNYLLFHKNRHLRRIPPLPHTPKVPQVPGIHNERESLLLQSTTLWSKHCTPHIHPPQQIPFNPLAQHGNNMQCLYRRLAPVESKPGPTRGIHQQSTRYPHIVGIQDKLEKVFVGTIEYHHVPRCRAPRPDLLLDPNERQDGKRFKHSRRRH